MFGMMGMGDLEDDPIFGQHMRSMRQMNSMMSSMIGGDPFAAMFGGMPRMGAPFDLLGQQQSALTGGPLGGGGAAMVQHHQQPPQMQHVMMHQQQQQQQQQHHQQHHQQQHRAALSMMPFGGLFGPGVGMPQLNPLLMGDLSIGGGAGMAGTSFSSSQVVTMSRGPDGRPLVYKATSSTKTGPGGVRETQKTVQDSRSGVKKMAIGHHIGERSHVVERERNYRTGVEEEREDFVNLEEDEADEFNREFAQRSRSMGVGGGGGAYRSGGGRSNGGDALAIMPAPLSPAAILPTPAISEHISRSAPSPPATSTSSSSVVGPTTRHQPTARRPIRNSHIVSSPLTTSIHPHPYAGAATSSAAGRRQQRAVKGSSPSHHHHNATHASQQRYPSQHSPVTTLPSQQQQQQQVPEPRQQQLQHTPRDGEQWSEEPL